MDKASSGCSHGNSSDYGGKGERRGLTSLKKTKKQKTSENKINKIETKL